MHRTDPNRTALQPRPPAPCFWRHGHVYVLSRPLRTSPDDSNLTKVPGEVVPQLPMWFGRGTHPRNRRAPLSAEGCNHWQMASGPVIRFHERARPLPECSVQAKTLDKACHKCLHASRAHTPSRAAADRCSHVPNRQCVGAVGPFGLSSNLPRTCFPRHEQTRTL